MDCVIDGDDSHLIVEEADLERILPLIEPHFELFGMVMKVEKPIRRLEMFEFCQTKPVRIDGRYIMIRNVPNCLSKDLLAIKPLNSESLYYRWCQAVGDCGLAINGGVPILQEFYQKMRTGVKPLEDPTLMGGQMYKWSQTMHRKYTRVKEDSRYSFYLAFGIDPTTQHKMEKDMPELPPYRFLQKETTCENYVIETPAGSTWRW
jgi:hypothetical protein